MNGRTVKHGAKFSDQIVDCLYRRVAEECARLARPALIVDPFAGTGEKIAAHPGFRLLFERHRIEGFELEPAFIDASWVREGNALSLPYGDGEVDVVFTSPAYGNRLADRHAPKDQSTRHSYTFWLRHNRGVRLDDTSVELHPDNGGGMRFGDAYQQLHGRVYVELGRVTGSGGLLLLNVSNFVRHHTQVDAVGWHRSAVEQAGFQVVCQVAVPTRRMRYGANRDLRVASEQVLVCRR